MGLQQRISASVVSGCLAAPCRCIWRQCRAPYRGGRVEAELVETQLIRASTDAITRLVSGNGQLHLIKEYKGEKATFPDACHQSFEHDQYHSADDKMRLFITSLLAIGIVSATTIDLPAGSGLYAVSLAVSNFTDISRSDPYVPNRTARNLMLSVFAPVQQNSCESIATDYMPPLSAAFYDQIYAPLTTNGSFEAFRMRMCSIKNKDSKPKHPRKTNICSSTKKHPLLIFSPGSGNSRIIYNALAQSIASHGYYVITIDHPYDALGIEYPDGSYVLAAEFVTDADYEAAITVRTQDIISITRALDTSTALQQLLPLCSVDTKEIYVAGHSLGGATALSAMLRDNRFQAGANLDGKFFPGLLPARKNTKRPFMLMGNQERNASTDDSWDLALERNIKGLWLEVQIKGFEHGTFTDLPAVLASAGFAGYVEGLGTVNGTRAREVVAEVLVKFMRESKHGVTADMVDELRKFPEVEVVGTGRG